MRSKACSALLLALAGAALSPAVLWGPSAAWADEDQETDSPAEADPAEADSSEGDQGGPEEDDPYPAPEAPSPFGQPGAPQPGTNGMPPLPFMPGYEGGSPFDGGGTGMPPLPFMPGYAGGSPFAGGMPPQ